MVLEAPGTPLRERQVPVPRPRAGEMLLAVRACGVCRTDLHIVDGELRDPRFRLAETNEALSSLRAGDIEGAAVVVVRAEVGRS